MLTAGLPIRGVVSGRTIVLDAPTGLPDGQPVAARVAPVVGGDAAEALRRAFGSWADDPAGVDAFVAGVRRDQS